VNDYNKDILTALDIFLEGARIENSIHSIVITGAGSAFCAGADLKANQLNTDQTPGEPDVTDLVTIAFENLRTFPKPAIAAKSLLTLKRMKTVASGQKAGQSKTRFIMNKFCSVST